MAACRPNLQPARNLQRFKRMCEKTRVIWRNQRIAGGQEDCTGRESLRMLGNLIGGFSGHFDITAQKLTRGDRIKGMVPEALFPADKRIYGDDSLGTGKAKSGIPFFEGVPQTDQIAACRETAGDVSVAAYLERVGMCPDETDSLPKILHLMLQPVLSCHTVGQDGNIVAEFIELCRDGPALGQVPHIDKSAAGNEQNIRLFTGCGILSGEPDQVHALFGRVCQTVVLLIERIKPLSAFDSGKQPRETALKTAAEMLGLQLVQRLIPDAVFDKVKVFDRIRCNLLDSGIAQQFSKCFLSIHRHGGSSSCF